MAIVRTGFDGLGEQVLNVCRREGWSLEWDHRGVYLHLEASEFIEAVRGKRGNDVKKEAADLFFTFLAMLASTGIPFEGVITALRHKIAKLDPPGLSIR